MKRISLYLLACASVILTGCTQAFDNLSGAKEVENISVGVNVKIDIDDLESLSNLIVRLDNYEEDLHYTVTTTEENVVMNDVLPGIYTVSVSGTGLDNVGFEYLLNGSLVNVALTQNGQQMNIDLLGLKKSSLIFKELYFAGCRTAKGTTYFKDNYYEVYNNSSNTVYLDGMHITCLAPTRATTKLPVWPEEDGNKYCYGDRVWKVAGSGTDYPLQPGESVVFALFGANHQLEIYNPASPVDLSVAEFEFHFGHVNYPDQPAMNMEHVFCNGQKEITSGMQWLCSVFGPAMVIFRVPEGDVWDPVNDPNLSTKNLATTSKTLYAKIPIEYVLDAVECVDNDTYINAKRVPAVLDAGIAWVGSTYCGLSVTRKFATDENGNPEINAFGAHVYMDTNNSSDDFECGVVPELRRHGAKMPSWNHSLK